MTILSEIHRSWETEELAQFRTAVRRFIDAEVVPHGQQWRDDHQVAPELWTRAGDAGLLCPSVPAEYGGGGGALTAELVVVEELARSLETGWGFGVHSAVVADYIATYGNEEQCQRWLPGMASGEIIGAIAMTEPDGGSDLRSLRTRAERVEGGYRVSGAKTFLTNGGRAKLIVLVVLTDPTGGSHGLSLLGLEPEHAVGLERSAPLRKVGQPSADTIELFLDDVFVPEDCLIGEEGAGLRYLMQQLPRERLVIAASAATAAVRAVEITVEYAKQRVAFGSTLFDMQNTRFVLAECATSARAGLAFLDNCIEQYLRGELDAATASMAKCMLTDVQCDVIDRCLQVFGGYGYMEEQPIAKMYVDARVQKIYGGANEVLKELISRAL